VSPITDDDLDRLADYSAGLLDPAGAAEVDRLIATDPAWAEAHAALRAAQPLVDAALAGLAEEPLPADVAARLDHAIHDHAIHDHAAHHDAIAGAAVAGRGASPDRAVAGAGGRPATREIVVDLGRARRRRRAALATAGVAAAVAAVAGGIFALPHVQTGTSNSSDRAPAAGRAVDSAPAPRAAAGTAAPVLRATGRDYTHVTLGSARAGAGAAGPENLKRSGGPDAMTDSGAGPPLATVPAALARLTDPAALGTCLAGIGAATGGQATEVDYAKYQGAPALIVTLAGGRASAVAAGPDCGRAGPSIIDTAP
jgi:hypothetical protein